MEIELINRGENKIIALRGEVDLYNISELKKALFSTIDENFKSIIIDMKYVNYMDSTGIGVLVAGEKKVRAQNDK